MSLCQFPAAAREPVVMAHLLGRVDFEACQSLQHRLVYEASGASDGRIVALICEHPETITIGRLGSRSQVLAEDDELVSRRVELRWLGRGGGALAHAPGQLAIYPIVPLMTLGWSVGEYLRRLQHALGQVLIETGIAPVARPGRFGWWGRSGQLAAVGAAVKYGVTYQGAFINVAPAMHLMRLVQTDSERGASMSSLSIERPHGVRMTGVRQSVVRQLAAAFDAARYHVVGGHPLLSAAPRGSRVDAARVG